MVLGVYKVGWKKKSSIFVEVESIDGEASWKNILKTVVLESVEILTSLGSNCFDVIVDQIVISHFNKCNN